MIVPLFIKYSEDKTEKYEVYFDDDDFCNSFCSKQAIEFEGEEEEESYRNKFENGELYAFYVSVSEKCECCSNYNEIDTCGGYHASSAEEALRQYLENDY